MFAVATYAAVVTFVSVFGGVTALGLDWINRGSEVRS
jgi:hypothetical protein